MLAQRLATYLYQVTINHNYLKTYNNSFFFFFYKKYIILFPKLFYFFLKIKQYIRRQQLNKNRQLIAHYFKFLTILY